MSDSMASDLQEVVAELRKERDTLAEHLRLSGDTIRELEAERDRLAGIRDELNKALGTAIRQAERTLVAETRAQRLEAVLREIEAEDHEHGPGWFAEKAAVILNS